MKVLLFYSHSVGSVARRARPLDTMEHVQSGLGYISSVLKKHGHRTGLLVVSSLRGAKNVAAIRTRLESFRPDVVGFYAVATEFDYVQSVARFIRSVSPDCYLVIGGPHVTLCPEVTVDGPFDAVCIGEGEYPTLELVTQLAEGRSPTGIAGLWIRYGEKIERNPPRPFLEDLDGLPFPDRDMWLEYLEYPISRPSLLLGRGCPFTCSYCSNHALQKTAPGRYVRRRSADSIAAEITDLKANYRFPEPPEIYFEVETFAIDMSWTLKVCHRLKELSREPGPRLHYGVNLRVVPDLDVESLFSAMAEADFTFVNIGLEAGSERVRREVLRRHYSNEDIINAVRAARRHGFKVNLFNMIGLPGETYAEHLETVRINRMCQPDEHYTGVFFPYPGTDLYLRCKEMGLPVDQLDSSRERAHAVMSFPEFSAKQIQSSLWWFNYRVYRGHRPLVRWIPLPIALKKLPWWLYKPLSRLKRRIIT